MAQGMLIMNAVLGMFGLCGWELYGRIMEKYQRDWGKFSRHTRYEVGNGSGLKSRYYMWCGDLPFKMAFLSDSALMSLRMHW